MKDCPFCNGEIKKQGIIYQDDVVLVFPTIMPITTGHILVCPTRHVMTIEELTKEELMTIFDMVMRLRSVLKKVFGTEGFNFAWNEGKIAGQSIGHLHVHIVPRIDGDKGVYGYDPRKFLYRRELREESPSDELQEITKLIKNELEHPNS